MSEKMKNDNDRTPEQITIDSLENYDFDIISDMPWAQKLWKDVQDHTKKGFLNWCNTVRKLVGTRADHVEEWSKQYCQTIDETCCDLVFDLVHLQGKTIDKIQELLSRLQKLCIELHQKMPQKIGDAELSLFEEQNRLMKQIQEYETIINGKRKELDTLHEKQRSLCKYMGEEPKFTLQYPPLPTPAQLEEFQKYIDQLEAEKFERDEKYCLLKHELMEIVKELKYKPNSEFERKVITSDKFIVSLDNMKKMELFYKSLKEIKKSTGEEISQLRTRIEDLWKMLDVDLMDRDEFRSHYTGNSMDTLEALRVEVKRCEEIRKANIKIFVDKMRVKLEEVWKKCHCSELNKRSFKYFNSDCYTEDLLDLHDIEIQKWNNFYEENSKLISLLEKHKELWEKVIELEESASGPNRYQNRGGKLLQEEKERNKLSKLIPKIEEEILALSEEYRNSNNGISFTTFGRTPEEYIGHMHADRENIKKLKLSARKIQRDNTMGHTPAKSAMSLFPSTSSALTPTVMSATKRKILATPNTDTTKRMRVNTPRSLIKPKVMGTPSALPKITVTHATMTLPRQKRRSRTSMERRKRLDKIRRRSRKSFERNADSSRNTTYTDFQTELSSREQWRSTILPDSTPLQVPAASSTRNKTPLKKTPLNTPRRTPSSAKTPLSKTPNSGGKSNTTKLSTCKSNLKLLF